MIDLLIGPTLPLKEGDERLELLEVLRRCLTAFRFLVIVARCSGVSACAVLSGAAGSIAGLETRRVMRVVMSSIVEAVMDENTAVPITL